MQCQSRDLLIVEAIAGDLAALAKEDEACGAVPVLDHIQAFVDFASELLLAQIPAQKDRLDSPTEIGQRLVGGMHYLGASKSPQDRFRVGDPAVHGGGIFHHFVILLFDLVPIDHIGENRKQVGQSGAQTCMRQRQLLPGNRFQAWRKFKSKQVAKGKADGALAMAVDIVALDLHVGAVPQHALDHRRDFRG